MTMSPGLFEAIWQGIQEETTPHIIHVHGHALIASTWHRAGTTQRRIYVNRQGRRHSVGFYFPDGTFRSTDVMELPNPAYEVAITYALASAYTTAGRRG